MVVCQGEAIKWNLVLVFWMIQPELQNTWLLGLVIVYHKRTLIVPGLGKLEIKKNKNYKGLLKKVIDAI